MLAAIVALRLFECFGVIVGWLGASEDVPLLLLLLLLGEDSAVKDVNVADDSVVLIGEGTDLDLEAMLSDVAV